MKERAFYKLLFGKTAFPVFAILGVGLLYVILMSAIDHSNLTYIYNLYHFIYFSVITFSTVGYGDISPVSEIARFVVMPEIFLSFFIIVFALANIKKIHTSKIQHQ